MTRIDVKLSNDHKAWLSLRLTTVQEPISTPKCMAKSQVEAIPFQYTGERTKQFIYLSLNQWALWDNCGIYSLIKCDLTSESARVLNIHGCLNVLY